jgi:hypothetical protein
MRVARRRKEQALGTEVTLDTPEAEATPTTTETEQQEQMCCDGSGRTAEQHRQESPDHKCCVDG